MPSMPGYTYPVKVQIEGAELGEVDFKAYELGVRNVLDGSTTKLDKVSAMTAAIRMRSTAGAPAPQEEEVTVDSVKGPMAMGLDGRPVGSMRAEDSILSGNTSKAYSACSKNWDQLTSTEKKIMLITAAKKNSKVRALAEAEGYQVKPQAVGFNVTRPYFDLSQQQAWQDAWTIPDDER
eukprot:CAMPEP_0204602090 /NCGR_PEP_ID=MMETSP0661-20131031/56443_1 /ASSEMBLY_ACC=CAM_ASM_000606 /TAXON_ID=109239 /ORGANISM="Alexandrium margalefi, Strain AMGDE01CS-322" /LENGTH=178 /DNA_ID=CAMNT_0051613025 /DNA_START=122 /DNA_END=656 /DNA_ORIENTATION=-